MHLFRLFSPNVFTLLFERPARGAREVEGPVMSASIYYDGDCPICARYVTFLRLNETVGPVDLVDLREADAAKAELLSQGFNVDNGMVLDIDGRRVGGADAMHNIALLSTPSTLFNKINKTIMSTKWLAFFLYPLLRAGRWLVLFFLGREQLTGNDEGARARASIFGSLFALFSPFHFFNYMLEYGRFPPSIDQFFILLSAIVLFLRPQSARLLWFLMFASTVSAIAQAPVSSNHTIVRNFVVLGYWISFFYALIRNLKPSDVFSNFTLAGQGALLVMYFFGVFHKINSDFLNPESSCAVTLWRQMPTPLNLIDTPWMHYLAIYGTFIVEGCLVLMLFSKRTRHIAVVCGILFHLLLGLSNYAMYISFTTLAISLHCLFLNEESALKIQNSKMMIAIKARVTNPAYFALAVVLILLLVLAGASRNYTLVTILVLPLILPFCLAIIRHGSSNQPLLRPDNKLPARVIGGCLTTLFFFNCWMPYMGLKSAQTVNMFANLRLEAGVSNHLIMKNTPGPFEYLEDVVLITDTHGDRSLRAYNPELRGKVYYDVLAHLADNPDAMLSYTRNGVTYENMTAEKLSQEISETLHPAWFRKWFHFAPASVVEPAVCY